MKMTVHFTCPQCGSGVHVYPSVESTQAQCDICTHCFDVCFSKDHEKGEVHECPFCFKKDFYIQKDFNRKIGVLMFILASILSVFTYGLSFIVFYGIDFFLFRKLNYIVVCYKCQTIFRNVRNINKISEFNHEMNDRIVYAGHDFQGKSLAHK